MVDSPDIVELIIPNTGLLAANKITKVKEISNYKHYKKRKERKISGEIRDNE